jgi:pilus assembly protein CpaE
MLHRNYPDQHFAAFRESERRSDPSVARTGKVISVFSPKGGVGKTTIATNLAISLVNTHKKRAVLIDGDLCFGTSGVLLGVGQGNEANTRGLHDLVSIIKLPPNWSRRETVDEAAKEITPDLIQNLLYTHSSGLQVMFGPDRPEFAETVPSRIVERCIDMCATMFDYVIVDTPSSYGDLLLSILDNSDRIILVVAPEMSALKNTSLFIDYARTLDWYGKLIFVLNRASSGRYSMMSEKDVKSVIKSPFVPIASSGTAVTAMNQGRPLVTDFRNEDITRDLIRLSHHLVGTCEEIVTAKRQTHQGIRRFLSLGSKSDA